MTSFFAGMTPVPLTARAQASYGAAEASRKAIARVFRMGGSIEEAQRAGDEAYRKVMEEVPEGR